MKMKQMGHEGEKNSQACILYDGRHEGIQLSLEGPRRR